ncbi:hypothetical protein ACQEV2_18980 [Streptomyces sp. CA-251387]|uniref:hypothetical protein n=1 Tax=Streptomyces sp. CA-251387 TaxID=3240064 RepID=UPI003D8C6212
MHRIFQDYPGLFSGVSEVLGIDFAPPTSVTILPNDLTDDEPLLLAIEAQGRKDPDKPASWAYYASYLLTKYRLQPMLLVVCQDRGGPATSGRRAITHAKNPDAGAILKAVTTVLRDAPQAIADPIIELISQGLGKRPAAELWRNLVAVDLPFYKSYIAEEIRDEGRAEGRAEDVLDVLDVRGNHVSEAVRERITACGDPETLRRWHRRAVTAPTAEEIFEAE